MIEANVLFPSDQSNPKISHCFKVDKKPVVLKVYHMPDGVTASVHMVSTIECQEFHGPYCPGGCPAVLSCASGILVLPLSGTYYLQLCCEEDVNIDDVVVIQEETCTDGNIEGLGGICMTAGNSNNSNMDIFEVCKLIELKLASHPDLYVKEVVKAPSEGGSYGFNIVMSNGETIPGPAFTPDQLYVMLCHPNFELKGFAEKIYGCIKDQIIEDQKPLFELRGVGGGVQFRYNGEVCGTFYTRKVVRNGSLALDSYSIDSGTDLGIIPESVFEVPNVDLGDCPNRIELDYQLGFRRIGPTAANGALSDIEELVNSNANVCLVYRIDGGAWIAMGQAGSVLLADDSTNNHEAEFKREVTLTMDLTGAHKVEFALNVKDNTLANGLEFGQFRAGANVCYHENIVK